MRRLLSAFKEAGGGGIEIVTGNNTQDDIHTSAIYARRFDLAGSAGSDFHGHETNGVQLGKLRHIPEDIEPVWNTW